MPNYEILTPTGWQEFKGIGKSTKECVEIKTSHKTIIASLTHKFIINNTEVHAKSLKPKDKLSPKVSVISVTFVGVMDVFDPLSVSNGAVYLHDDFVTSHNSFLGSSRQLLTSQTMSKLSYDTPIQVFDDFRKGLQIYKSPIEGHLYTMTVDVSRGRHLDASAFMVFDITDYPHTISASYNNNEIAPMMYSNVVHQIAKEYNNAYVLIEINDVGAQVADELYYTFEYENMYWTRSGDSLGTKGTDPYPGVRTTKKTKRIGCANLKDVVEKDELIVNDFKAIQELSTFVQNDSGSWEADEGQHDDMVACLWLFTWLLVQPWFKDMSDKDIRSQIYDNTVNQIMEELTPFGYIRDGQEDSVVTPEEQANFFR